MSCAFEGCDRLRQPGRSGLCFAHYQQRYRGKELTPLRPRKELHQDAVGRVCTVCEEYQPWSAFYEHRTRLAREAQCKECHKAYDRNRTATGANKRRANG